MSIRCFGSLVIRLGSSRGSPVGQFTGSAVGPTPPESRITVLESLNAALHTALENDPRVYVLGEDILDPYGGAFKVTRGLSTRFPDRVLTTPISEAAILGISTGMALRGLRPVAEVMFGDFITLMADRLINHAAKFRWMYNEQVRVPLVLRAPMGGRRGYGPTHSQSLEKLFLGVPGLKVLASAHSATRAPCCWQPSLRKTRSFSSNTNCSTPARCSSRTTWRNGNAKPSAPHSPTTSCACAMT